MPNAHDAAPDRGARESARLLAEAGWSEVLDSVLRGLRHDLNSRVTSLDAIVTLAALDDLDVAPIATVVGEVERLTAVGKVLALLPGDLRAEPIPLMPQDTAARAIQVTETAMHVVGRRIELVVDPGVPPVLANEARALRSTVLLLHRLLSESSEELEALVAGDEQHATLTLRTRSPGADPPDHPTLRWCDPEAEALEALFRLDGGELRREESGVTLRFASLAQARARGL